MANYIVSDTNLTAVANAIRQKGGTSASLEFPDDFVSAIGDIQTGGGSSVTVEALNVTQNGTYTAPSGTAYSPVTVNVSGGGTDYLAGRLNNTLTDYSSDDVTEVPNYGLRGFTSLQTILLPNATKIGQYAFYECTGLTSIKAPKNTLTGTNSFYGCTSLVTADLGKTSTVPNYTFYNCNALRTVVLRKTGSITTATSNSFANITTPSNITVYVPSDLKATYEENSSWIARGVQFAKLEGSIYE